MADKIRIEINHAEVERLLKAASVPLLESMGASVDDSATANAGDGAEFGHATTIGRNRARCTIWTANFDARHAEATTRALTRAIDAGRR